MVVRPALAGMMRRPYSAKNIALISSDLPRENSATKATMTLSARTWVLQPLKAVLQSGIEQFMVLHPVAQQPETQAEFPAPCTMLVELLVE
jgi:hypothetical protein